MGSKQKNLQQQQEQTDRVLSESVTGLQPFQNQFAQNYGSLNSRYNTMAQTPIGLQYGQVFNPNSLQYSPAFSNTFDPVVNYGLSRGYQDNAASMNASNTALANQLNRAGTGNNSALLSALQFRNKLATAGANNALLPGALDQQRQYDVARQNIIAQQNQTRLAGQQQMMGDIAQQNQARLAGRDAQLSAMGQQQNLLHVLNQMADLSRGRVSRETGGTTAQTYGSAKKGFI